MARRIIVGPSSLAAESSGVSSVLRRRFRARDRAHDLSVRGNVVSDGKASTACRRRGPAVAGFDCIVAAGGRIGPSNDVRAVDLETGQFPGPRDQSGQLRWVNL